MPSIAPENDDKINNLFDQKFVRIVQLDSEIAKMAKKLLRNYRKLRKPSDAIHLAAAVYWDVDQLHLYDGSDLIGLSVTTESGRELVICKLGMIDGDNLFNRKGN